MPIIETFKFINQPVYKSTLRADNSDLDSHLDRATTKADKRSNLFPLSLCKTLFF